MKRRIFANADHQSIYDELRLIRPDLEQYRAMGGAGGGNAYVVGYTLPEQLPRMFLEKSRS